MTPQPSEYGRALRNWRKMHSLRVEDVAHHCKISATTIRNHEQGRSREPSRLLQRAIVDFSRERGIPPPAWWIERRYPR